MLLSLDTSGAELEHVPAGIYGRHLEIARYLQEAVGQRIAAAIAGLVDTKQIGRYAREDGPEPHGATERRMREGYKVVRMLVDAYDAKRHARGCLAPTRVWTIARPSKCSAPPPTRPSSRRSCAPPGNSPASMDPTGILLLGLTTPLAPSASIRPAQPCGRLRQAVPRPVRTAARAALRVSQADAIANQIAPEPHGSGLGGASFAVRAD